MKTKLLLSCLMILTMLFVAGCGGGEPAPPPPTEKAPEPEKTPEQIAELIKKDLAPLEQSFVTGFSDAIATEVLTKIRGAKAAHQATENGKIALESITGDIEALARRAKDEGRWKIVMCCIDAYDILQPGTTKYQRLKQTADLQIKKPRVKLKGFFRDVAGNNQLYAFVEITDPVSGTRATEQMREGEEKMGLKFTRIIGNQQGVEFEYLAIPGDVFTVKK